MTTAEEAYDTDHYSYIDDNGDLVYADAAGAADMVRRCVVTIICYDDTDADMAHYAATGVFP